MKIECDVCEKEEASVFCCADEAALCGPCDRNVHHANKLARKHPRFSLIHPASVQDTPLCDICQKRRGMLFCREDRAIVCRECDDTIHKANEHTQKHNRFLLSGLKLSPLKESSSLEYQTSTSSNASSYNYINAATSESGTEINIQDDEYNMMSFQSTDNCESHHDWNSTSSISEYLMEALPGWHVEDFLDPSSSQYAAGFYDKQQQPTNGYMLPYIDDSLGGPISSQDACGASSFSTISNSFISDRTTDFNHGPVIVKSENKGGKNWSS